MMAKRMGRAAWLLGAGLAGVLSAGVGLAQQTTVAGLKQVTGSVLVSRDEGMSTGSQAQRLVNGTRIITTANSEAIVAFDNGCEVRIPENHRFEVDSEKACALLVAQALGPAPAVAALGPGLLPTLLVPGGAGALLLGDRDSPAVSPN